MNDKNKQDEPILVDTKLEKPGSPLIWIILMSIPLIIGVAFSLSRQDYEPPKDLKPSPPVVNKAEPIPNVAAKRGMTMEDLNPKNCDYKRWVGLEIKRHMVESLKDETGSARPYRIVPEGSFLSQDFNPERVNFELSDDGTITAIWCG